MEGMMGMILILTRQFILNNSKKCIMKSQNSSSKNTIKICLVCELHSVEKHNIDRQIHQISFCFYFVKGWIDTLNSIIWFLEEPVRKTLSKSHVIR